MLTKQSLYKYVYNELGLGGVEIELTEENINACILSACEIVNAYCPPKRPYLLPANTQRVFYFLRDSLPTSPTLTARTDWTFLPTIQRVTSIHGVRQRIGSEQLDLFDPLVYITGGTQFSGGLSIYDQTMQYMDRARLMFGAQEEFDQKFEYNNDFSQNVLACYYSFPAVSTWTYGIEVRFGITPDNDNNTGMQYLAPGMTTWFLKYVLAQAKGVLGRVRGKFRGIPATDGGVLGTDAEEMMQESRESLSELEQSLKRMFPTLPIIIG